MKKAVAQFGCFNVKTGEFQQGYLEKGKMKFRKSGWWKTFSRPQETKFIDTINLTDYVICSDGKRIEDRYTAALYKDYNPFTNKIYRLYAKRNGKIFEFNVDAYEKDGSLVNL